MNGSKEGVQKETVSTLYSSFDEHFYLIDGFIRFKPFGQTDTQFIIP